MVIVGDHWLYTVIQWLWMVIVGYTQLYLYITDLIQGNITSVLLVLSRVPARHE